jgi:hypothetical protein
MLAIAGPIVAADGPVAQRRAAAEYVSKALQAESEGKNSRRAALLYEALEAAPDYAAARWHSGYVRANNCWVKFDEVHASAPQDERLAVYRRLREKYRETVEDQLALAAWCKKAGLQDQWRAHLGNVLALNPDHAEARGLLGYQRVDGVWLTPQEIAGANVRAAAAIAALKQWKPKLLAIRNGLQNSNPNRREVARKRLAAVQDAAAVPSLELVFCGDSEPMGLVGVNHFAEMSVADASPALARQALFSRWPAVRKAAVEKLKTRSRETYVPQLLSTMASPTQSRVELYQDPAGRLLYRHAFYRPGQERDELLVLDTMYDSNFAFAPYISSTSVDGQIPAADGPRSLIFDDGTRATLLATGVVQPDGPQTTYSTGQRREAAIDAPKLRAFPLTQTTIAPANRAAAAVVANPAAAQAAAQTRAQAGAQIEAAATAQARETAIARQNAQTAAVNNAICQLLTATTGENLPQSPEDWSEWWADTDEVYVPGYKPLETTYIPTEQSTQQTMPVPLQAVVTPAGPIHYSCLAAGTPIWTDAGPVAVEKIKVGDRVLAQHFETGELAYKPVLHTTVRLKAELVKLELVAADAVTCSVGHPFWISGKGWVKARDIQPQMNFHGAAGTTPLRRSEPAGVGPVYNVIVADFHSYFVGDALIYSHDITARKPSDLSVPGLPRR